MDAPVVLVTGASGFTGRYLVPALEARGYRVVGLSSEASDTSRTRAIACDLTDSSAVRAAVRDVEPVYVVHLAALAFVGHDDGRGFYDVNLFGTLNLLDALSRLPTPPRKVLIASSANVYGKPCVEVIDESVCPAPVNHYACSKLAMEHMVRTWFERLPILISRPFNYTGVGQDERFLVPKMVAQFRRRAESIELGNLDVSRDFSDVRDVIGAYIGLLESGLHSDVFNVCSGKAVALRELLTIMQGLTGHAMEVSVNPEFVRANEIPVLRGSHRHLTDVIGYKPSFALRDTLSWMLAAGTPNDGGVG
ncbi:NAD-dependent epimerase/dehydratase family protein [Salinisphaera sp. SWV1]|uniref:NAD-dependent epimerase/dehydratase family protein n=1 Tax=Salinisphaera sp. SWV1 TaxID=3454139 RepID=UPI003F842381